ncbi:carboxypeptidase-like regulatory domain-containing protein [Cellulomonas alba]|uniref:Carboxypeptidase-like regulatory domain-containing protein n=1 Tax=Cellulomonas alba TaxID=3053467 RepID=A0ABT7SLY6_9CELL|nr:carboxypeptidase-like regulatory domain-containing protein [Cellulomonas alba]MDM7856577.1 carboxypeptidase-like regulatory domain-containing protein [Cellulomonas alba]
MTTAVVALAVLGATLAATPAAAEDATHVVAITLTTEHGTPLPRQPVDLQVKYGGATWSATSDQNGVVSFPGLAAGDYLMVLAPAPASVPYIYRTITVADTDVSLTVAEPGVSLVTGTVVDAATGNPMRASVDLSSDAGSSDVISAESDGNFVAPVATGSYYVTYTAYDNGYERGYYDDVISGGRATRLDLTTHDSTGLQLRMHRPGTLAGKVTLAGTPKASAVVVVPGVNSVFTSSTGTWSVTSASVGTYRPYVEGVDGATFTTYYGNTVRRPDARSVTLQLDHAAAGVDIAIVAQATIKGSVLTASGKPAKYIDVEGFNTTRAGHATAKTDGHGRYVLRGLATGPVAVAAYAQGASSPVRTVGAVQGATVNAPTLKTSDDARLAVTIRTVGSSPTKQDVSLFDAHHAILGTFRPDSTGKISLWSLAAGTYYLTIDGSNVQKKLTLKAHQHLNLGTLTRGRLVTVSGTVKTAAGKPAVGALVLVMDARKTVYKRTRTDAHGHYSVKAAVSGSYRVTVDPTSVTVDAYGTVALKVTAGHAAKANVRLTRPGTVTGRVLNAQGKPAVGVHVLTLSGRDVRTNASGVFTITGLHAGTTYLFETDRDYVGGYRNASEVVTVHAGRTTTVATIRIP